MFEVLVMVFGLSVESTMDQVRPSERQAHDEGKADRGQGRFP